jgi:polyisoprenoid-binding protein YceI
MRFSHGKRFLIAAPAAGVILALLALPAAVRSQTPAKDADKKAGTAYEVDTRASRVYVKVDPDGRGHAHGIVGQLTSGAVTLGAAEKAGQLVFDLTSFDADDPEVRKYVGVEGKMSDSDRRGVTRAMLGSRVLDTQEYPTATYTIASVKPLDRQAPGEPGRYQFEGRLSLHGVEQPVRFEAKAEKGKTEGTLQVRGKFSLLQTDYKIKPYSALFGAVKIKDELEIHGDLLLVPRAAK